MSDIEYMKHINRFAKFMGDDWAELLSPFLLSDEYKKIGHYLRNLERDGYKVVPDLANIFRALKECRLYKMHSIIIGMDVYPYIDINTGEPVADGIAFSSRTSKGCPALLNSIFEAIDTDIFHGQYTMGALANNYDLTPWANEGILLLNCGLTTLKDRSNEHIILWKPFIEYLLREINIQRDGIGVILMGGHAGLHVSTLSNKTYKVYTCEHPTAAMYKKRAWRHENVFKKLTDFQKRTNNIIINW